MSVLIEEIPIKPKKVRFPKNIEDIQQIISDIGTFMIFVDNLKRESALSFVLVDVFDEMIEEKISIGPKFTPYQEFSSIFETIEILCDKELVRDIKKGLKEIKEGNLISQIDFVRKHKLE